jgi:hypothetical protein
LRVGILTWDGGDVDDGRDGGRKSGGEELHFEHGSVDLVFEPIEVDAAAFGEADSTVRHFISCFNTKNIASPTNTSSY